MTLHREGKATIIITLISCALLVGTSYRLSGLGIITYTCIFLSLVLLITVLQFFRYPNRHVIKDNEGLVIAPADGKVVVIEDTIESEYFEDERLLISIFMSPLNVHSNHHPISGEVVLSTYHAGKYLVAWHPKSSTENERHTTVYKKGSQEVLVRQIAGALARRIVNYVKPGDKVDVGGEVGFIKFGSRVDIYLPVGTAYKVKLGQKVRAKLDVIAELV